MVLHLQVRNSRQKEVTLFLSPPYHPHSNGLGERAVGIIKNLLLKKNNHCHWKSYYLGIWNVEKHTQIFYFLVSYVLAFVDCCRVSHKRNSCLI
uniref:Integrase catalytic domain-containing protein n=1 Tax=Lepeophtheirus salmonis TaxID=72036 RepID=A0A0K2T693_LEPSM